jgi:hypothetical protein
MTSLTPKQSSATRYLIPILIGITGWGLSSVMAASLAVSDRPAGATFSWSSPDTTGPKISRESVVHKKPGADAAESAAAMHLASDNVFDNGELRPHWGVTPDNGAGDEFRKALSTMDSKLLGEKMFDRSLIVQDIWYRMPEAGEVYFVWGVNGWKPIPEKMRPPNTTLTGDKVMATRMVREGDAFVVRLTVQNGTTIDYGFSITRARDGNAINVWDADKYPSAGYQSIAFPNRPIEVSASLKMARLRVGKPDMGRSLVTHEIRYPAQDAQEISLVWGINGWRIVPEADRPPGTVVKEGRMLTPLSQESGAFVRALRVPPGTTLDYGFLIMAPQGGNVKELWDDNHRQFFHTTVAADGSTTVKPTVRLPKSPSLP